MSEVSFGTSVDHLMRLRDGVGLYLCQNHVRLLIPSHIDLFEFEY
jgi:hypothetical protein